MLTSIFGSTKETKKCNNFKEWVANNTNIKISSPIHPDADKYNIDRVVNYIVNRVINSTINDGFRLYKQNDNFVYITLSTQTSLGPEIIDKTLTPAIERRELILQQINKQVENKLVNDYKFPNIISVSSKFEHDNSSLCDLIVQINNIPFVEHCEHERLF